MAELINIRASSADRIMLCNYSSINPEMMVDTSGPWTNFGKAGHSVMGQVVKHDMTSLPDISTAINEYGVEDERALRIACYVGLKEYKETIRPSLDRNTFISEEKMSRPLRGNYLLTGHTDLSGMLIGGDTLFVGDWKFGVVTDHWNQLKAYAFILFHYYPSAKTVLLGAYFLRENEKSVKEFTREYIEGEWADQFYEALESQSLHPCFDACKYCPIVTCQARDKLGRATIKSLATIDDNQQTAIAMANKYEDVMLIERFIAKYKEHIKSHLQITERGIVVDSGKVLTLIQGHRDTIYFSKARRILSDYFGTETDRELLELLVDCITIKKTALLELVGQHAAYRMKGKEKKRIAEEMEQSGAIKTKLYDKITLVKGE